MIDHLREFAEALRRNAQPAWAGLSDELLELLDERDDQVDSYRRIMERVDEVGPGGMDDEAAAMRILDRYGELCDTLKDVEGIDPNSEEKPGAVEAFVRQADADMLFRHGVREALVAFGAVDKDDKETDLLAMLRALLEV